MATYTNPWYKPGKPEYGPPTYETRAVPMEYHGYLIYERIPGTCWDVVKDGACVTQRAGLSGAKWFIDARVCLPELRSRLRQLEGDSDEAANERNFTLCAKLNREAAIVRASISEREAEGA